MSKYAQHTLQAFVAGIRELEKQATAAARERDRLLAKAREAAQTVSDHTTQAANLREILTGIDAEFYREHLGKPFDPDADPTRDALIAGMRDALGFLEATPELPFSDKYLRVDVPGQLRGATDQDRIEKIDRIAQLLGVQVREHTDWRGRPCIEANRDFGPVRLYADAELDEPAPTADAAAAAPGEVLDERMQGMGEAAAPVDLGAADEDQDAGDEALPDGVCGARAVDLQGATGTCCLAVGHDNPAGAEHVDAHFDPRFGSFTGRQVLNRDHDESSSAPGECGACGVTLPGLGYCLGSLPRAAARAEQVALEMAVSAR
ncbi:hypothetical protein KGA66_06170 [Actinocrinis puniceicyclus]|uniref:Uncharacterized protein n=1 Tax=Actinocrinis puniceicyclus TaxID=977794 RepID=A0A8J7WND5_9ACTN|nr:hypothetical protein [Actinocrinis puniceicyclus]MBS2962625.1 hypothetical protein [Actinocrinis puniceicyclus]